MIMNASTFIRLVVVTGHDFEYKNKWYDDVHIITLEKNTFFFFFFFFY